MKRERLFLTVFCCLALSGIFLIGSFNYFIDPFEYFDSVRITGFNSRKLTGTGSDRFEKAIGIMVKKPRAIMLGSSRVRAGFQASYFSKIVGYSPYKAALSWAHFDEIFDYFEHALHNQPDLKAVFINIDFSAFSKNLKPISEFDPQRLKRTSLPLTDVFKLLFSKSSLETSYSVYHHNCHPEKLETPSRYHIVLDEGDYFGVNSKVVENPQLLLEVEKQSPLKNYEIDESKVEMFRKIVQTCRANNIDLRVVFSPAHALY